ncbi:HNH endonuclease [Tautonia plasticadhaerens]|uniref:HNH nuclease domain-containing protein n=1 Tax=Tautonia plasticadhaerens TaxID=2527974 RepID=A0A518H6D8_9BACT|nr:HNH endonuclease [Tautonia plasticadhaerens]QDV36402.1 hypothetical protein ElP_43260 [Tautonia plasticadhaerens]
MVHHLVLEAFVCPRPPDRVCCHNDGNASNNRIENLRWDTHLSNTLDKAKHGTQPRGEAMSTAKLKEWQVLEIRRLHSEGVSVPRLAKEYGVRPGTIRKVVKRQSWTHLP